MALKKIYPDAWKVIGSTFDKNVPSLDEGAGPSNGPGVTFTENLLRSILDLTSEQQMERLLRENENRGKTPEQQIREGMMWEPIEEKKAKARQGTRNDLTRNDLTSLKIFKDVETSDPGNSIDSIARRVGLGSGVTFAKGKARGKK